MKTIIWKELRENLKWAALVLLALAAAEIFSLYQQRDRVGNGSNDLTLCSSSFLLVSMLGCAVAGALIGSLQIVPELRRDQWAGLLHRPLSRHAIYFGKAAAGLLLYFLATVPPLLASVIYTATPGQIAAPFVPGMVLGAASDLFVGMACYFTALLVSLHRGPWYGTRGLLTLSIFAVFVLHFVAGWIFLLPVVACLVLMFAAGGAMATNGPIKDYPPLARFSTVLVVLTGVEVVLGFALMGLTLLSHTFGPASPDNPYRNVVLTTDGQILVSLDGPDNSVISITDVHGAPVTDERYLGNARYDYFCYFTTFCADFEHADNPYLAYFEAHPRDPRNYVELATERALDSSEAWYLLPGKNYFVGYDRISRQRIGFLDRGGFHTHASAFQPFIGRLNRWYSNTFPELYWSGQELYAMDFSERRATLFPTPQGNRVHGAAVLRPPQSKVVYSVAALEKEIQFFDPQGTTLFAIPYGHDPSIWRQISASTTPSGDRIFIIYEPFYPWINRGAEVPLKPTFIDEIDPHGKTVHVDSLPPMHFFKPSQGRIEKAGAFTLPLAPAVLAKVIARIFPQPEEDSDPTFWQGFAQMVPRSRLATLGILCAVLAFCAYGWGRRAGLSSETSRRWALFVFLFGLPGLIAFRLTAGWPARVRCPHCSRKRSVEIEECPYCHQTWPGPELNGTEIFELTAERAS